jgi:hypothetical protein
MIHLNAAESKKSSDMRDTKWVESPLPYQVAPVADLHNLQSKADKDMRRGPAVAPNAAEIPQFHLETSVVSLVPQPGHEVNPDFACLLHPRSLRNTIVAFCQDYEVSATTSKIVIRDQNPTVGTPHLNFSSSDHLYFRPSGVEGYKEAYWSTRWRVELILQRLFGYFTLMESAIDNCLKSNSCVLRVHQWRINWGLDIHVSLHCDCRGILRLPRPAKVPSPKHVST